MENQLTDECLSVWVCLACGKMSHDQYGDKPISSLWDVSCVIHAQQFPAKDLLIKDGRVYQILVPEQADNGY